MWIYNDDYGVHWITRTRDPGVLTPPPHRDVCPRRPVQIDDVYIGVVHYAAPEDLDRAYNHVANAQLVEIPLVVPPFPKTPNPKTLQAYMKDKDSMILDGATLLTRSKDRSFVLRANGNNIFHWKGEATLVFLVLPAHRDLKQVETIQKYIGDQFVISLEGGVYGVRTSKGPWMPIFNSLTFNLETLLPEYDEQWFANALSQELKLQEKVNQYLTGLTCQTIGDCAGSSTPEKNPIFTRCKSCQSCDAHHLKVHIERQDIDPYLIYSAYEAFGPAQPLGGPVRLAWDLIEDARKGNVEAVENFKKIMSTFLQQTLPGEASYFLKNHPAKRAGAHKFWTSNGGLQLHPGPDGILKRLEPPQEVRRLGDELARELRENDDREGRRGRPVALEDDIGRAFFAPRGEVIVNAARRLRFGAPLPAPVEPRMEDLERAMDRLANQHRAVPPNQGPMFIEAPVFEQDIMGDWAFHAEPLVRDVDDVHDPEPDNDW
jgi:hypothetical protein